MNQLNQTFIALSDPTRRLILDRLRQGTATVTQLAEPFGISQQAVSKHLACLERASLIEKQREGRQQLCSLKPAALKSAYDWIDGYRLTWTRAFDRLDVVLVEMQQEKQARRRQARKKKSAVR